MTESILVTAERCPACEGGDHEECVAPFIGHDQEWHDCPCCLGVPHGRFHNLLRKLGEAKP